MKKLISILVALAMMMTLAITAFAVPNVTGTDGQSAAAAISKTFKVPEGTTFPTASFDFIFTNVAAESNTGAPAIDVDPITYSSTDTKTAEDGVVAITKDTGNFLSGVVFPAAGRYVYTVIEQNNSTKVTGETWTDSQAEYKVTIDVANGENGLYVKNIAVQKTKDDAGNAVTGEGKVNPADPTDGKANGFNFVNTYTKKASVDDPDGGDPEDPVDPDHPEDPTKDDTGLYVEKSVVGELGDKTKDFTFNVLVAKPALVSTTAYKAQIVDIKTNADVGSEITFTPGTAKDVTLKHGQRLVFKDLDYGAKVTVIEAADADYKGALTEAGLESAAANTAVTAYDAELITDTATRGKTVYNQNKQDDGTTPTGILMNNLPYILLAVVAAGGLIAYLMMKRREANAEA